MREIYFAEKVMSESFAGTEYSKWMKHLCETVVNKVVKICFKENKYSKYRYLWSSRDHGIWITISDLGKIILASCKIKKMITYPWRNEDL